MTVIIFDFLPAPDPFEEAMITPLTGVPRRHAILVDAGYLLAASAHMIQGTSLRRSIEVDWAKLIEHLKEGVAERAQCSELLRLFWYDATDVERTGRCQGR